MVFYAVFSSIYSDLVTEIVNSETQRQDIIHLSTNFVYKEYTLSGEALFLEHDESLKTKFRGYNINPYREGPTKDVTTGK